MLVLAQDALNAIEVQLLAASGLLFLFISRRERLTRKVKRPNLNLAIYSLGGPAPPLAFNHIWPQAKPLQNRTFDPCKWFCLMDYLQRSDEWIPKLGFGTSNLKGKEAEGAVEFALDVGYRHFDTANAYENEQDIGPVLSRTEVSRERLFITTKVWGTDLSRDRFLPSVEESLRNLQLDYVDLLLIHWPHQEVPLEEALDQLQEAQHRQYARLIGVSNFTIKLLEETRRLGAPIVCNQFEYHPFLDQRKLRKASRDMGLFVTAYSPIAQGMVSDEPEIQDIAATHKVRPTQVALRWLVQQEEVVAIPKSAKLRRIRENFDVFNFSLSPEEMDRISALRVRGLRLIDPKFAPQWD